MNFVVLVFTGGAVASAVTTALTYFSCKASNAVSGSLFIGIAFALGALTQSMHTGKSLPGVVGLVAGAFLMWVGIRKYQRDPEGRTPPAQIV
jgi:hypothetical protein